MAMVILYLPKAAILRGERESKYSMIVWERGTLQSILTISVLWLWLFHIDQQH